MADPNWNRGFYYDGLPPHTGMKLARRTFFFVFSSSRPSLTCCSCLFGLVEIATITYRSGPDWDQRFGRNVREPSPEQKAQLAAGEPRSPMLCPDFLIETYLDHQVCFAVVYYHAF